LILSTNQDCIFLREPIPVLIQFSTHQNIDLGLDLWRNDSRVRKILYPLAGISGSLLNQHPHGEAINQTPGSIWLIPETLEKPGKYDAGCFAQAGLDFQNIWPRFIGKAYLIGIGGKFGSQTMAKEAPEFIFQMMPPIGLLLVLD
jgi:hypothetical protein